MKRRNKILVAAALALSVASVAAVPLTGYAHGMGGGHGASWQAGRHIDGRIAFLKAELKITPTQEAAWKPVEDVMRQHAAKRAAQHESWMAERDKPMNALQRLELGQSMASERAKSMAEFVAVFKPFYAQLSDQQKKSADELFQRGHHGERHGGGHHPR